MVALANNALEVAVEMVNNERDLVLGCRNQVVVLNNGDVAFSTFVISWRSTLPLFC